ncbi:MAG: hypothetical protein Q7S88_03735 [Candidatus Daviesbacteria bacterium]|nr:hypothetical protein [Candidatus Daviesbacteria bacterium]
MAEIDKSLAPPYDKLRDWMTREGLSFGYARDSAQMVSEFFEDYLVPAGCKSLGISTKNLGARNYAVDLVALQPSLPIREADNLTTRLREICYQELQMFHFRDEPFEPEVGIALHFIPQADLVTSFEQALASKSKKLGRSFIGISRQRSTV